MGLFHRKKKQTAQKLPEFPQFPQNQPGPSAQQPAQAQGQHLPNYEQEFKKDDPRQSDSSSHADPAIWKPAGKENTNVWRKPQEHLPPVDIPQREPAFVKPQPTYPQRESFHEEQTPVGRPSDLGKPPVHQEQAWVPTQEAHVQEQAQPQTQGQERPVFVKIQQYREAMSSIELLKQKIQEIEQTLEHIGQLRSQEQTEISNFHTNMNKMKEKLVTVDKKLFEV